MNDGEADALVESDSGGSDIEVTDSASNTEACGPASACPVAVIHVGEGQFVHPQTKFHLDGAQSFGDGCEIGTYMWEVSQPEGSTSLFMPSASVASPTFEAILVGLYTFRLTVIDERGVASCAVAEASVLVQSDDALRIELLWTSPNDPDETDEDVGADLDLHFAHPFASTTYDGDGDGVGDGWFDATFDCFWMNGAPNWGWQGTRDDDPVMQRDDTDGRGPEVITMFSPEPGAIYKVGVHYWNDHGFGPSYATVRVYFSSTLAFEASDVMLGRHDMWFVTTIAWPASGALPQLAMACAGTSTSCTSDADCEGARCEPRITPNYTPPGLLIPP